MDWKGQGPVDPTNFVINGVRFQTGMAFVIHSGTPSATVGVTFPSAFAAAPTVQVSVADRVADFFVSTTAAPSATGCTIATRYYDNSAASGSVAVAWTAIGPA